MDAPRQGEFASTGRVNQKRRTRAAIVSAAKELLADGVTPTVAEAANRALVSRTTAYRYFPTQEALLLEVAVNVDVDEIEALAAQPVTASSAGPRTLEVIQQFNRHVLASEVQYRTTMRAYLDMWLSGIAAGDAAPVVREGRRYRWISQTLEPLRGNLTAEQLERLVSALSLVSGFEAIIVLRDVCHLDDDRALEVTEWAATTLLAAAIGTDEV